MNTDSHFLALLQWCHTSTFSLFVTILYQMSIAAQNFIQVNRGLGPIVLIVAPRWIYLSCIFFYFSSTFDLFLFPFVLLIQSYLLPIFVNSLRNKVNTKILAYKARNTHKQLRISKISKVEYLCTNNLFQLTIMSDFEYQTDSDLESNESSFKRINRYKKDTRCSKRRSKKSNSIRSRTSSASELNMSIQGSHSYYPSRSGARSRSAVKVVYQ